MKPLQSNSGNQFVYTAASSRTPRHAINKGHTIVTRTLANTDKQKVSFAFHPLLHHITDFLLIEVEATRCLQHTTQRLQRDSASFKLSLSSAKRPIRYYLYHWCGLTACQQHAWKDHKESVSSTIQLIAQMQRVYYNIMASSYVFFPLKSTNLLLFEIKVCNNKSLMHILVHCLQLVSQRWLDIYLVRQSLVNNSYLYWVRNSSGIF